MDKLDEFAILINAYNRPTNFQTVILSIEEQVKEYPVYLFFDKPVDDPAFPSTSKSMCEKLQEIQIEFFREHIPHGKVFFSDIHKERHLSRLDALMKGFEVSKRCLYLKDCHQLHPQYIEMILNLLEKFESDNRVGMVGCYGDVNDSLEDQEKEKNNLKLINHLWGWATWKDRWDNVKPLLNTYRNFLEDWCIRGKPENEVLEELEKWHVSLGCPEGTFKDVHLSVDSGMSKLFVIKGYLRLSTYANYLGLVGYHYPNLQYLKRSIDLFGNKHFFDEAVFDFEWNDKIYDKLWELERVNWKLIPNPKTGLYWNKNYKKPERNLHGEIK